MRQVVYLRGTHQNFYIALYETHPYAAFLPA